MSVATANSSLFPTALRHPVQPDFDCANRVIEDRDAGKLALPRQLSTRMQNPTLIDSLKRDTTIRVPSVAPRRRPPVPLPDQPIFVPLPRFNPRNRQGREPCPEAEDALEDPSTLPEDPQMLRLIADDIRLERDRLGDEGDYLGAQHYDNTLAQVKEKLSQEETLQRQISEVRQKAGRHQELEEVVDSYAVDWNRDYEQFRERAQIEAESLQQQHEEELERFDAASPFDMEYAHRKRSPRLLQLRHKETNLVLTKRFQEAEQQRQEADDKEEDEIAAAIRQQRLDHMRRRQRLVEEQNKDMQALLTLSEATRQKMLYTRSKKLAGYLKRMTHLNGDLETQLDELGLDETEVCDPEPDQERMEFARTSERNIPVPVFPRIALSVRVRSPKPRRKGLFPRQVAQSAR